LEPLKLPSEIWKVQQRYTLPAKEDDELSSKKGAIYHVAKEITPQILHQAAEANMKGTNNIVIAPMSKETKKSATAIGWMIVGDDINIPLWTEQVQADSSGNMVDIIYIGDSSPEGLTFGQGVAGLLEKVSFMKDMRNILAAQSLEPLAVVTDKDTFKEIHAMKVAASAVYIVEGNNKIKWAETRGANRVHEGIYADTKGNTEQMLGIYAEAIREKKQEGFVKAMEIIIGVNWELVSKNPDNAETLAGMLMSVGAGNVRLTGIPNGVSPQLMSDVFGKLKNGNASLGIMRDISIEKIDDASRSTILSMLVKNDTEKGINFDGIEINLRGIQNADADKIVSWLNSISEKCAENTLITAILPEGMAGSLVSSKLRANVSVTEDFSLSDGGANKCVKVTVKKGFDLLDVLGKIKNAQGNMFEISFEEGVVINGGMLDEIAKDLKEILNETPSMVYQVARNYPRLPERKVLEAARGILLRHKVDLNTSDFAIAFSNLSGNKDKLESLLIEFNNFVKALDGAEQKSPFFDKLIDILNSNGDTAESKLNAATKVFGLVMGVSEASLTKEYLNKNGRKGFADDNDRIVFGKTLWQFENIREEVLSIEPLAFMDKNRGNYETISRAISAMRIMGEDKAADRMLIVFGLFVKEEKDSDVKKQAAVMYAGLSKDAGHSISAEMLETVLGVYSGDIKTIIQYNLTGKAPVFTNNKNVLRRMNLEDLKTPREVFAYASAAVSYGEFSYSDTANMINSAKLRLNELAAGNPSISVVETFRILDLLSDEKMKVEAREKKSLFSVQVTGALLGAG